MQFKFDTDLSKTLREFATGTSTQCFETPFGERCPAACLTGLWVPDPLWGWSSCQIFSWEPFSNVPFEKPSYEYLMKLHIFFFFFVISCINLTCMANIKHSDSTNQWVLWGSRCSMWEYLQAFQTVFAVMCGCVSWHTSCHTGMLFNTSGPSMSSSQNTDDVFNAP